jgi:hypothetical protein
MLVRPTRVEPPCLTASIAPRCPDRSPDILGATVIASCSAVNPPPAV